MATGCSSHVPFLSLFNEADSNQCRLDSGAMLLLRSESESESNSQSVRTRNRRGGDAVGECLLSCNMGTASLRSEGKLLPPYSLRVLQDCPHQLLPFCLGSLTPCQKAYLWCEHSCDALPRLQQSPKPCSMLELLIEVDDNHVRGRRQKHHS